MSKTSAKSLISRILSSSGGRKNASRSRSTSPQSRRRMLRAELLEDRRLLAADFEAEIPLGTMRGVFFSGLGGQQSLEAAARSLNPNEAGSFAQERTDQMRSQLNSRTGVLGRVPIRTGYEPPKVTQPYWNGGTNPGSFGLGLDLGSPQFNEFTINSHNAELRAKYEEYDLVVIAGYSLGGDTALSLARRLNFGEDRLEVDALALIDASESSVGLTGFRAALNPTGVTPNVNYFFNRWQTNYQFPIDIGSDGRIEVEDEGATFSNQEKYNDRRNADGSTKNRGCEARDYLKGFCKLFGATKTSRIDHQQIANDDHLEALFTQIIVDRLNEIQVAPTINGRFASPNSIQLDGQDQKFIWDVTGHQGKVYLEVKKGNSVTTAFHEVNANGSFNFNNFGLGTFEFSIFAEAYNAKVATYKVVVSDDDRFPPSIVLAGSSGTISDQQSRQFEWSVSDVSGLSNVSVVVTGPSGRLFSSSDPAGLYSLNSHGPGNYRITVNATDADNDWPGDQMAAKQQTRAVTVYDDDTDAPLIAFFDSQNQPLLGSGTIQSHGLDNRIGWSITDESGLSSVLATLKRDGQVIEQRAVDAEGSIDLNGYGLGAFELTLTAADGDADGWLGDTLVTTSKAYLTVTNAAPTVFIGGPYVIGEGDLLGLNSTGADLDPGDTETLVYHWDLNNDGIYGDATSPNPVLLWETLKQFGLTDDGTYPISVRVEDVWGAQAYSASLVTVQNAPPSIVAINAPTEVDENSMFSLTGSFSDPGPDDTHSVMVDWGDGTSSLAIVDAVTRTFAATHRYADDQPTGSPVGDYIVQVTVTDDDGGVSGDELRSATAITSAIAGIEYPSFTASLPSGTAGLMLSAETTIAPQPVTLSTESAQEYAHSHTIDFPGVGLFNLPAVTTSVADASDEHGHTYPTTSQTITTSQPTVETYYKRPSDLRTTVNAQLSSSNGDPAGHTHETVNAIFETQTTFKYTLPAGVLSPSTQSNTNYVRLNGDARFVGINTHLTPNERDKQGSIVVRQPRRTTNFVVNFDHEMLYGNGGRGMSFGYAPMSESALFGEGGISGRAGLWVTMTTTRLSLFDLYERLEVWYNGVRYAVRGLSSMHGSLRGVFRNMNIDVDGPSVTITNAAAFSQPIVVTLPSFNPSANWRFGFGARTTGFYDWHVLGRTTITDRSPPTLTSSTLSRTGTNEYILPRFDTRLGNLVSATTKLILKAGTTTVVPNTPVPHAHSISLDVGGISFATENFTSGSASQSHSHNVTFSPQSIQSNGVDANAGLYSQAANQFVAFLGSTSTTDFGHAHTLAPHDVSFDTVTTFQYDATKTKIAVRNVAPRIEQLDLDSEVDENGTVTLQGTFTDVGTLDTHRVVIDWGDGTTQTLAVAVGSYTFQASHLYRDDDPTGTDGDQYQVTVRVEDDDTGADVTTGHVFVRNIAPVLVPPIGFVVDEGQWFDLPATRFSDVGRFDTHRVTLDWGNGDITEADIIQQAGTGVAIASYKYPDDGDYQLTITLTDDDGGTDSAVVPITVRNVAPSISSFSGQLTGAEGSSLTFSAVATDPGDDTLTYTWDFGDGTPAVSGTDLSSVDHVFSGDGVYFIQLTVSDEDGGSTTAGLTVSISDVAAQMFVSGAASVEEGSVYTLTLGEIVDPGNDPINGIQIDWGDGNVETYPSPGAIEHIFTNGPLTATISVSLIDQFDAVIPIAILPVSVQNVAPTIQSFAVPPTTLEGSPVAFSASATDTAEDTLTYIWDFGDGSQPAMGMATSHTYADDGLYQVKLTVSDEDGGSATTSAWIMVSNVVPTATLQGEATAVEGSSYVLMIDNYFDPGADTLQAIQVDWGDGNLVTYPIGQPLEHQYADGPVEYTITVTLIDDDGAHLLPDGLSVAVLNAPPTIHGLTGDLSGNEGQRLNFQANATDPGGVFDALTYSWDFGDGTVLNGIGLQSTSHAYADDGLYMLTLTVTDDDGGVIQETFEITVYNVAPSLIIAGAPVTDEGDYYGITLGPVSDPGNDTVTGFIVDWGDGQQTSYAYGDSPAHQYTDGPATRVISVSLIDEDGQHTDVAQMQVDVLNVPPTITELSGDSTGAEGSIFSYSVTATDRGTGDLPLYYSWNFGDGSPVQSGIGLSSVEHVFVDNDAYLVEVTVDDGDGGQVSRQFLTQVFNVAPSLVITAAASIFEGQTLTLDLSQLTDPGEDFITQWVVEWGDGQTDVFGFNDTISHSYVNELADVDIIVHAFDEDGFHSNVGMHRISIINSPPTILLDSESFVVAQSNSVELTGLILDAGVLDSQLIQIDWGNGEQTELNLLQAEAFSVLNSYDEAGIFVGSIRVEDSAGDFSLLPFEVDVRPKVNLTLVSNASETANKPAVIRASISRPLGDDVVLAISIAGTATPGVDYNANAVSSLTIPAGQTEVDWIAIPVDDELVEGSESIVLQLDGLISAPAGVTLGSIVSVTAVLADNDPDSDLDGISAYVEDGGPNGGDSNYDGVLDSQQNHVASFQNAVDSQYLAMIGEPGTQLRNVISNSVIPVGAPESVNFAFGMLEFEVSGIAMGADTTVSILLPVGSTPTTFYKYGPTADNPTDHWYDFSYDPDSQTGAIIDGNQITLHLIDGGRGDADLVANGTIKDPGAVAWVGVEPPTISIGGPYVSTQGSPLNLQGLRLSGFPADEQIATWEWDLNYEGPEFEPQLSGQQVELITQKAGRSTLALRVTTESGTEFIATTSMEIINLAPVAFGETATLSENEILVLDVLANDRDPGGDALRIVPASVKIASATFRGEELLLNESTLEVVDGQIVFNPGSDFDFLSQFDRATVTVEYTIADDATVPLTATAQAIITIQGENDVAQLEPGNPILVDDLDGFAPFRISDFIGSAAIVGSPAQIVDVDETEPPGIMLTGTEGLDGLAISIDNGVTFTELDLASLDPTAALLLPADTRFVVNRLSSGLAKVNYLPWDHAVGVSLQTIDAQLLQQVGQLPENVGTLSLVFAETQLPGSTDEGAVTIGRIELTTEAEMLLASSGIDWTDNITTTDSPGSPMSFIYPDGPADFLVQPFLIDETGVKWNLEPRSLFVRNVAPVFVTLYTDAETLETRSADALVALSGSFFEQGWEDTHSVVVEWGDGISESVAVDQFNDSFAGQHHYAAGGIYTIQVTVTDSNGASAQMQTQAVVEGVGLVGGTLYVIGTDNRDDIDVEVDSRRGQVSVDAKLGRGRDARKIKRDYFADEVDRVIAHLFDGDDRYTIKQKSNSKSNPEIALPQLIFGGAGDDRITADRKYLGPLEIHGEDGDDRIEGGSGDDVLYGGPGNDRINGGPGSDVIFGGDGDDHLDGGSDGRWEAGNDIIVGGAGDDRISGGRGRDLLIGGTGEDDIRGNSGGDLLIGGFTAYDLSLEALRRIHEEWTSERTYDERIENLRNGTGPLLAGSGIQLKGSGETATVFDDGQRDRLRGGSGSDWYFAQLAGTDDDDRVWKHRHEIIDLLGD